MRYLEQDDPELFTAYLQLRHLDDRLVQVEEDYEAVAAELRHPGGGAPCYSARLLCELREEMLRRVSDTVIASSDIGEN